MDTQTANKRPNPKWSEKDFLRRLENADRFLVGMYKKLSPQFQQIARIGIQRRMANCERLDVPFHPSIAREIIEDAARGRAIYNEV